MIIEVYNTISNKCTTVVEKGFKDEDCEIFIREIEGADYDDCMRQTSRINGMGTIYSF